MAYLPKKVPKAIQLLFPTLVWDIQTEENNIYLTFDDGPTPEITEWVLDTLSDFNAKATFFCIGKNIEENPAIFQRLVNEGHGIGNHTFNHLKGWKTKTPKYIDNILLAKNAIENENVETSLFRPPYGRIKRKQIRKVQELGYQIIMWNVLPVDWSIDIQPEDCTNYVLDNAKKGSIVVFHDSVKAARNMQYALPIVLQHFSEKGFSFKRIPE